MEHSLSPFDLPQPWRTRAIVAAAVAVVELFLLMTIALALLSKPITERVTAAATTTPGLPARVEKPAKPKPKPVAPAGPKLTRAETAVLVLNGSGETGAAAGRAEVVRSRGYLIGGVGNAANNDFSRTVIMYRPGYKLEAMRLARDTGVSFVSPLDGLTRKDLLGAHLAFVVGAA
jgi:hypothetical protein